MPKKPALKPSKDDKTKVSTLVSPESTEKTTVRDTNTMGVSKKDKRKLKRQKLIQSRYCVIPIYTPRFGEICATEEGSERKSKEKYCFGQHVYT